MSVNVVVYNILLIKFFLTKLDCVAAVNVKRWGQKKIKNMVRII